MGGDIGGGSQLEGRATCRVSRWANQPGHTFIQVPVWFLFSVLLLYHMALARGNAAKGARLCSQVSEGCICDVVIGDMLNFLKREWSLLHDSHNTLCITRESCTASFVRHQLPGTVWPRRTISLQRGIRSWSSQGGAYILICCLP